MRFYGLFICLQKVSHHSLIVNRASGAVSWWHHRLMFIASGDIIVLVSQMITELSDVSHSLLSRFFFFIQLTLNCSKQRELRRLWSPFKCKITHIEVPKLVVCPQWPLLCDLSEWMILCHEGRSYFPMILSHRSLRFCTLDDCRVVLDCCRLTRKTALSEPSLFRICHLSNPGYSSTTSRIPTCSFEPDWAPS